MTIHPPIRRLLIAKRGEHNQSADQRAPLSCACINEEWK